MPALRHPTKKALSIGSVMIDIITVIADNDIELMTLHNQTSSYLMLEQGRKIESESIDDYVGGGGANTAVCMGRLGMEMDILALIKEDLNGKKIRRRLEEENIGLSHLQILTQVGSGVAVHVSSHDRNAAIFTHRGANCCLNADMVKAIKFTPYELVYITNLSNESADQFPLIVSRAQEADCFIASNPGIRQLTRRSEDFLSCLPAINLLSINKVECEALIPHLVSSHQPKALHPTIAAAAPDSLPPLLVNGFHFAGFSMGLLAAMKILADQGPDYVVITDGSKGAYLLKDDILYYCPPMEVVMRGSAGAGDSFSSTLASLISAGNTPDVSLYAASLNAVSVISEVDTQTGLLTFDQLSQAVARGLGQKSMPQQITQWDVS